MTAGESGECRVLSNFDGQVSLGRFTGERHVPINGDDLLSPRVCICEPSGNQTFAHVI